MTTTLSASLALQLSALLAGSADLESVHSRLSKAVTREWSNGAGAGQAALIFSDERTLASNTSENLDLAGSLVDALGNTLNFAKVKLLLIVSDPANTTGLTIGNVANGISGFLGVATNYVVLNPGGVFLIAVPDAAGYGVTATTADLLKIANAAGAAAIYDIVIIGA